MLTKTAIKDAALGLHLQEKQKKQQNESVSRPTPNNFWSQEIQVVFPTLFKLCFPTQIHLIIKKKGKKKKEEMMIVINLLSERFQEKGSSFELVRSIELVELLCTCLKKGDSKISWGQVVFPGRNGYCNINEGEDGTTRDKWNIYSWLAQETQFG